MHSNEKLGGAGKALYGLLAINGVLLLLLAALTLGRPADAQVPARGEYTMVAGGVNGAQSGAVWIVDTVNQELVALTYDPSSRELVGIGYRNLIADREGQIRGNRPR